MAQYPAMMTNFDGRPLMIADNPPAQPSLIIQQARMPVTHTSCGLITNGVFLTFCGIGSIGIGVYAIMKVGTEIFAIASCASGGLVTLSGVLAIYGGSSVWSRKGSIVLSSVLAFFAIIACLVVGGFSVMIADSDREIGNVCYKCHEKLVMDNLDWKDFSKTWNIGKGLLEGACEFMCTSKPFLVMLGLSGLEVFLSLILFYVSCCNTCACCCCYKDPLPPAIMT